MNLYRQNKKTGNRRLFYATILAVVLFFADFVSGGSLRSLVHMTSGYLYSVGTSLKEDITQSGIVTSRASLTWANKSLQSQLDKYQEDEAAYMVLLVENKELRSIVHLATTTPGVTAPITSSFYASPYSTFLIGAGSADKIEVGNLVVTSGGFVLGKVSSVETHQSTVSELFAPHTTLSATLDTTNVTVTGWGGGNARTTVPHGVSVAVGDPVIVPSFGGRSVGTVGKVIADPASAETQVFIYLPVNRSGLHFVYVIKQ